MAALSLIIQSSLGQAYEITSLETALNLCQMLLVYLMGSDYELPVRLGHEVGNEQFLIGRP